MFTRQPVQIAARVYFQAAACAFQSSAIEGGAVKASAVLHLRAWLGKARGCACFGGGGLRFLIIAPGAGCQHAIDAVRQGKQLRPAGLHG